jgi:putative mycofactocin binding protein MftB
VSPLPVLDRAWELAPQVSVRPEPFGALLYHFGTRRLSFLKDRRLLAVVRGLAEASTARDACAAAGVDDAELATYERALARLASTDMVRERVA